jgi:hypothetical protein
MSGMPAEIINLPGRVVLVLPESFEAFIESELALDVARDFVGFVSGVGRQLDGPIGVRVR